MIVVFFHGNGATLERDVRDRQLVPQQISDSGVNAVLLAPQLAVMPPTPGPENSGSRVASSASWTSPPATSPSSTASPTAPGFREDADRHRRL